MFEENDRQGAPNQLLGFTAAFAVHIFVQSLMLLSCIGATLRLRLHVWRGSIAIYNYQHGSLK